MDLKPLLAHADSYLSKLPPLVDLEKRTGVPKSAIALVLAGAGLALSAVLFGLLRLATISGFAYPAYATLLHLSAESREGSQAWLSYWLLFGLLTVLECFGDFLEYWIPMYPFVKAAGLAYLYLPQTMGAKQVYDKLIVPYLLPRIATKVAEQPKKSE